MNYPNDWSMLAAYLKEHPIMKVKLPTHETEHVFQSCDGLRLNFVTSPDRHLVSFACNSLISGSKLEYNEDGFTRTLGNVTAWYYYTGPKPWQDPNPEWKQKIEDWNDVLAGLKGFTD